MTARILITDGEERSALAATRSLGRAGYEVYVCSSRERCLAGSSRYARAQARAAPAGAAEEALERVASLTRRWGVDLVLPMTDRSSLLLLGARDRLAPAVVAGPDAAEFARISDKSMLSDTASHLGIAIPEQRVLAAPGAPLPEPLDLPLPLVVKPARSVALAEPEKLRVVEAESAEGLRRCLDELPAAAYPILLQRKIRGPGIGVFLLRWNGRIVASFAHRRLREKPPRGGVSVYRESIPPPQDLLTRSARLLAEHRWQGVAMIEFKRERETGTAYLMEVNGRLWGSLQLAIDAGVDFPRLFVEAALGNDPEPVLEYRIGVRTRWWWGDVDHHLARLRGRGVDADVPKLSPARALLGIVRHRPGDRLEVLRLRDPVPFFRETVDWLKALRR